MVKLYVCAPASLLLAWLYISMVHRVRDELGDSLHPRFPSLFLLFYCWMVARRRPIDPHENVSSNKGQRERESPRGGKGADGIADN